MWGLWALPGFCRTLFFRFWVFFFFCRAKPPPPKKKGFSLREKKKKKKRQVQEQPKQRKDRFWPLNVQNRCFQQCLGGLGLKHTAKAEECKTSGLRTPCWSGTPHPKAPRIPRRFPEASPKVLGPPPEFPEGSPKLPRRSPEFPEGSPKLPRRFSRPLKCADKSASCLTVLVEKQAL